MRLVEVGEKLPGLKISKGLETWVCASKEGEIFSKWEDVPEKLAASQLRPSMFPPQDPTVLQSLNISRCVRILPHLQNTGGFFVALLEKVSPCPWMNQDSEGEPPKKKPKTAKPWSKYKEDPYEFFPDNEEMIGELKKFYNINLPSSNFFHRSKNESSVKKNLYLANSLARDIVRSNSESVKVIGCGVKVMVKADKQGSTCPYRIAQAGRL